MTDYWTGAPLAIDDDFPRNITTTVRWAPVVVRVPAFEH
jgi:hypothetical protein